ncbi:hypothetical protein B0H21DRAFT_840819, partial [Amylocystis lapponica]
GQNHVVVYALHAGSLYLPDKEVFEDAIHDRSNAGSKVPSFAFLIEHSEHGKILFDLGLRKDGKGYPPAWDDTLQEFAVDCPRDVVAILGDGGISPSSIATVIYRYYGRGLSVYFSQCAETRLFSHLHFDHVGDLTPFASAELVLGGGAEEVMQDTYPSNPESLFPEFPTVQKVRYIHFHGEDNKEGAQMLPSCLVTPVGAFANGLDLFGDGSLYLLDAPGHFPGHLAILARVASAHFVLLAADCCHNRLCYNPGDRLISRENYENIEVARETVQKLKYMDRAENVVVVLAHEKERLGEMPLFPASLNGWVAEETARKRSWRRRVNLEADTGRK